MNHDMNKPTKNRLDCQGKSAQNVDKEKPYFRLSVCLLALLVFIGTGCDTSETISSPTETDPS